MIRLFLTIISLMFFCFDSKGQNNRIKISQCVSDTTCTSDPTYKYFEKEQLAAYCISEEGQKQLTLLLDKSYRNKVLDQIKIIIDSRPNSINNNGKSQKTSREVDVLIDAAQNGNVPTCYQDPLMYFMIYNYVSKIENARKKLKLPLKIPPKFGSLPTPEINAYTYPADNSKDRVEPRNSIIGFNTLLFMFAYQMPKVILPTLNVSKSDCTSNMIVVDYSMEEALRQIQGNPNIKINFAMAILEFMGLSEHITESLDAKFDADLMGFTTSIELFAVAHEYGHLIMKHELSGIKRLKLSTNTKDTISSLVGTRSWQQELEADKIGIELLVQVLKNDIATTKDTLLRQALELRSISNLYSILFYFKCMEIIEDANFINDKGVLPKEILTKEKEYLLSFAQGKFRGDDKNFKNSGGSHPPAWLRYELAKTIIEKFEAKNASKEAKSYSAIGKGLVENANLLWKLCMPVFPELIATIKEHSKID
ncbi:hypothetical protein [Flavobacterium flavigenum]|uniref:hypothetical protein n=1 Tax=Flavobacterium flavigenum TaxID=3003258 RepID=UPI0022AC5EF3|nr:hypothetical protein [Flavobacterium flavigenum]